MKIFVTGASGFVGGAFARFAAPQHLISAMSRSERSDAEIRSTGATIVRCSLDDVTADHLRGADAVVHSAAYVEDWGPWREYWRYNFQATERMLKAAKDAGVKRFIHIGTEAALFHGQNLRDVDETYPLALTSPYPYPRTKAYAERAVLAANDPLHGFETIVLRPRFVWGPGDKTLLPVIRTMVEQGAFAWIGGENRSSTTYIGNLSYAINLALRQGRSGEAYFVLDGPPVKFREFLSRLTSAAGFDLPTREVPGWLARGSAYVIETAWRTLPLKGRPPLTRFGANVMSRECVLNDAKARRDMDYRPPFTIDEGLAAVADEHG